MSRRTKMTLSFIKVLRSWTEGPCLTCTNGIYKNKWPCMYRGERMSDGDEIVVKDALACFLCVLRDGSISGLEIEGVFGNEREEAIVAIDNTILGICRQLPDCDIFYLLKALDAGASYLLDMTYQKEKRTVNGFKRHVLSASVPEDAKPSDIHLEKVVIGRILGLLKTLVRAVAVSMDIAAFRTLRTVFCYLGRLSLRDVDSLKAAAFEKWWESERKNWKLDYSGPEEQIVSEWFPYYDRNIISDLFKPKHGAGTTKEGIRSAVDKSFYLGIDMHTQPVLKVLCPEYSELHDGLIGSPYVVDWDSTPSLNAHKVAFVPKSWKTYRTISEESVAMMWAQQGAMNAIFAYLKTGYSDFSKHYCVDTEDRNRRLAQIGSRDGSYATIDMSAASDSVALDLVNLWFSKSCLCDIVKLRSEYAVFDCKIADSKIHDVIRIDKFAPMGSAICFPIECIVFGAIVESTLRKKYGRSHNQKWYVYGDDIVCPVAIVPDLLNRLRELGFTPNEDKSFFNTGDSETADFFRESCGGEYLNGTDVRPLRISRKFSGFDGLFFGNAEVKARTIVELITLANAAFDAAPTLRNLIVYILISEGKLPILFDADGSRGLKSVAPSNFHLTHARLNKSLQCLEFKCITICSDPKTKPLWNELTNWELCPESSMEFRKRSFCNRVRLFEALRISSERSKPLVWPEDQISETMSFYQSDLRIKTRWVPISELAVVNIPGLNQGRKIAVLPDLVFESQDVAAVTDALWLWWEQSQRPS